MSQQINLLNAALVRKRYALTPATMMLAGAVLTLAASGGVALYEHQRLDEIGTEAAALESRLRQARAAQDKHAAAGEVPRLERSAEAELAQLGARLKTRRDVLDVLKSGGLGSTSGFSEYMRAFSRQAIEGLWLTGFDIADGGAELTLTGRALTADLVPAYLERLNREAPLQGRHFASMRIVEPKAAPEGQARDATGRSAGEQPAAPRYLEFEISSAGIAEHARRAQPPESRPPSPANRIPEGVGTPGPGAAPPVEVR